jgi:HemY protein
MKRGIYFAGALLVGALLADVLLRDPGQIAISVQGYLIDLALPVFVLLLVAVYFMVRLVVRWVTARRLQEFVQLQRRRERARRSLVRGLLELSSGNWQAAENTVTQSIRDAEAPVTHYLTAARAAELLGNFQRRDEWLAKALESAPEERTAVLITQAEFYLKHNQLAAALTTLEQLETLGGQNSRGLMLLARIHRQQGNWQALRALEPRLRNARDIRSAAADELLPQIYLHMFKELGTSGNAEELLQSWKDVPKPLAERPEIIVAYARAAIACGEFAIAERRLRELINQTWDEAAVLAFGDIENADALTTLDVAEKWLPAHPEDPALLLTCGRLCLRAELYGKARSYLETSLALRPRLDTYQILASLLEQLGERERALKILNEALVHAVGRKASLPRLRLRRWAERRMTPDRRHS